MESVFNTLYELELSRAHLPVGFFLYLGFSRK